jgi:hypothetical protein
MSASQKIQNLRRNAITEQQKAPSTQPAPAVAASEPAAQPPTAEQP